MSQLADKVRNRAQVPSPATARAILLDHGVTHQAFAEELGLHRVTVTRWLSGRRTPRGALAERYVALLEELKQVPA